MGMNATKVTRLSRRVGLLLALGACASIETSEVSQDATCSPSFCGGNSPEIGHYGLYDLNLDHRKNAQGFVLLGASLRGVFYDLDVSHSAIRLRDSSGKPVVYAEGLVGTKIWLARGTAQYSVAIDAVGTIDEVVDPGFTIQTYVLDWSDVVGSPLTGVVSAGMNVPEPLTDGSSPVCPTPGPWPTADSEWDESTVMAPYDSLVFEGDRIHDTTRTVDQTPNDRWFNIGCARHTLAKMRLTRNTLHTVLNGDWRQVQATLKMLSADYCGTGTAYTVAGTPIVWRNAVGMSYLSTPIDIEARWDENGAICLTDPRLAVHPELNTGFPDLMKEIIYECEQTPRGRRPICDPDPFASFGELITTGNH